MSTSESSCSFRGPLFDHENDVVVVVGTIVPSSSPDVSPSTPTAEELVDHEEVQWTDAQIRWSVEDGVPERVETEFIDPFSDPTPTQVFSFHFRETSSLEDIELSIHGYKTQSDQVWQSTGLTLWKASKYLCDYMVDHASELQNKSILELGAGLGLNGILAHRLAPETSTVVVTDGDTDALVWLRKNIAVNQRNTHITASQLIWKKATAEAFSTSFNKGVSDNPISPGRFDIILASDIIYAQIVIDPLWETVQTLLSYPNGSFWMAFALRKVPVTIEFVLQKAKEYGFHYTLVAESTCDDDDDPTSDHDHDVGWHKNSAIQDAAGADQVFIYRFQWDISLSHEM
jgi:hypothetical protein